MRLDSGLILAVLVVCRKQFCIDALHAPVDRFGTCRICDAAASACSVDAMSFKFRSPLTVGHNCQCNRTAILRQRLLSEQFFNWFAIVGDFEGATGWGNNLLVKGKTESSGNRRVEVGR